MLAYLLCKSILAEYDQKQQNLVLYRLWNKATHKTDVISYYYTWSSGQIV